MSEEGTGEKRRYSRVEIQKGMWVAWEGSGQRLVSRVFDLSLGGVFIPTPKPPPVGTSIKLVFEMSGRDIRARAIVRRTVSGSGMGVEFVAMGYQERGILLRLLKRLAH
jgi:PilZ domain-containing protein